MATSTRKRRSTRSASAAKSPVVTPVATKVPRKSPSQRTTRLEEKTELQELNTRLQTYMNRLKGRNAAENLQQDLEQLRKTGDAKLKALKGKHEADVELARERRDAASAENAELRETTARRKNQLKQLGNELRVQNKYTVNLELRVKKLESELEELNQQLDNLGQTDLEQELASVLAKKKQLVFELQRVRTLADESAAELASIQSRARNTEEDIALAKTKVRQEREQYQAQLADLSRDRNVVQAELRTDFKQQMDEILNERQEQFEEERDAGLADLQAMYQEKLEGYRTKLDETTQAIDGEQEKIRGLRFEWNDTDTDDAAIRRANKELEEKIESARLLLTARQEQHSRLVETKTKAAQQLRERIQQQEIDFEALMDVKISLAMEIKTYRLLLDTEDERLEDSDSDTGDFSPSQTSKRRKLAPEAEGKDAAVEAEDDDEDDELYDPSEEEMEEDDDDEGDEGDEEEQEEQEQEEEEEEEDEEMDMEDVEDYDENVIFTMAKVDLKSGKLQLTNKSKRAAGRSLDGWSLRAASNRKSFKFMSQPKLMPGDKVEVLLGQGRGKKGVQRWADAKIFSEDDQVMLIDPCGKPRSTLTCQ